MEQQPQYHKRGWRVSDNSAEMFGKVPPQAPELEQAVLGALMIDRDCITAVADILTPECFYMEHHREIYRAIQTLFSAGSPVDILIVSNYLKKTGSDIQPHYLAELTNRIASAANVEYHARIIAQKYIRRRVIEVSASAIQDAYDDANDDFSVLEQAERGLFSVWAGMNTSASRTIHAAAKDAFKSAEKATQTKGLTGVPSGFTAIDRVTGGWQRTDLIILAARPGMGKTSLAVNMGFNAAKGFNMPVAVFSLEMSQTQLATRILSDLAEIDSHKMRQGKVTADELMRLAQITESLATVPLYIDETPGMTIFQMRAALRRLKMRHDIQLVIVDYLQLMSGMGERGQNRDQQLGEITKGLKLMAKEMNVAVIALSQLSRAVEIRGGAKRPQLSDLRESGNLEQDADVVAFLYRPEYYGIMEDESGASLAGVAEVIFAKHRNGALGTERLRFQKELTRFSDPEMQIISSQFPARPAAPEFNPAAVVANRVEEDIPF